jgi:hypothetical protein
MKIKCGSCKEEFEGKNQRSFDYSKLPLSEQKWPFPVFSNILKEFINYQKVRCPFCHAEYKDRTLKLLFFFSPLQILVLVILINVALILFFLYIAGFI